MSYHQAGMSNTISSELTDANEGISMELPEILADFFQGRPPRVPLLNRAPLPDFNPFRRLATRDIDESHLWGAFPTRRTTSKETMATLKRTTFSAASRTADDKEAIEDDKEECPICRIDYEPGVQLIELPCGHAFHPECVSTWLEGMSDTCPMCRAKVPETNGTSVRALLNADVIRALIPFEARPQVVEEYVRHLANLS